MPAATVRRPIPRPPIRLYLDDPARGASVRTVVHEYLSEQRPRNAERGLKVETPR